MNKFISTKFFCTLQETSKTGADVDADVLKTEYDEFVMLLFAENTVLTDKTAFRNALIYTRIELSGLTGVSGKKCVSLLCKSH